MSHWPGCGCESQNIQWGPQSSLTSAILASLVQPMTPGTLSKSPLFFRSNNILAEKWSENLPQKRTCVWFCGSDLIDKKKTNLLTKSSPRRKHAYLYAYCFPHKIRILTYLNLRDTANWWANQVAWQWLGKRQSPILRGKVPIEDQPKIHHLRVHRDLTKDLAEPLTKSKICPPNQKGKQFSKISQKNCHQLACSQGLVALLAKNFEGPWATMQRNSGKQV